MVVKSKRKFLKRSILLATGLLLTDSFWAEKFFVEVKKFSVGKHPASFTFVQVSDLHLNSINYPHRYIAKEINKVAPDLVLFTGDALDKGENLPLLDQFLDTIDYNIKKVAIIGNWEYWGGININALASLYQRHNCDLLINDSRQYKFNNKTISVTGLDDYIGGQADYELAMTNFTPSNFHVVLTHCPQHRDIIETSAQKADIDIILSGHTHGGQINLFGYAPFTPKGSGKYVNGWYRETTPHLYVSKGVGTSILPIRLGARAEIAIFYV